VSGGYTYTTLTGGRDEPVQVRVSFYLDDPAWIRFITSESGTPHLVVSQGDVSAVIGPASAARVTGHDARLARELADRTAEYAAEIERLAALAATNPAAA
jgi:hypothetical protein